MYLTVSSNNLVSGNFFKCSVNNIINVFNNVIRVLILINIYHLGGETKNH